MKANVWKKSSWSNGNGGNNCVEIFWKKSSKSNPSGNCVEARAEQGQVLVRDTKLGAGSPVLSFPESDWAVLLTEIKRGVAYPVTESLVVSRWNQTNDHLIISDARGGSRDPRLIFTRSEWTAFVGGVKDGEFDLS